MDRVVARDDPLVIDLDARHAARRRSRRDDDLFLRAKRLLRALEHVDVQRARYARRRAVLIAALEPYGLVHDGGPSTFYLWLRNAAGEEDGWRTASRLAETGLIVAPGEFYGDCCATRVRLALTLTDDQIACTADRLAAATAPA